MYCKHCGRKIADDSKYCQYCGKPQDLYIAETDCNIDKGNVIKEDNNIGNSEIDNSNEWVPVGEKFNLKDIWEVVYPEEDRYSKIDGETAEVVQVELDNGDTTLCLVVPFKDGTSDYLKLATMDYEEGDKILISSITVQELKREGYDSIVRYSGEIFLSTEVTNRDLKHSWIDDYGVQYNSERNRLLGVASNKRVVVETVGSCVVRFIHSEVFESLKECSVSEGTETICDFAFRDCYRLESISIPKSVNMIGRNVFENCSSLSSILVPIGTKPKFEQLLPEYKSIIEERKETKFLSTEVTKLDLLLSNSDEYYVKYSRNGLRLLKSAEFKKESSCQYSIYESQLELRKERSLFKIGANHNPYEGMAYWDDYSNYLKYKKLKDVKEYSVIEGTLVICDYAFSNCGGLKTIKLPMSLEKIGICAFDGCDNLTLIIIPIGTRQRFEQLLPEHKDKLIERAS